MAAGELIIATGALRLTGTMDAYVDRSYPAVAHHEVVMALIAAAEEMGEAYHLGLAASVDSFYAGEVNPMPGGFTQSRMEHVIEDLTRAPRRQLRDGGGDAVHPHPALRVPGRDDLRGGSEPG